MKHYLNFIWMYALLMHTAQAQTQSAKAEVGVVLAVMNQVQRADAQGRSETLKRRSLIFQGDVVTVSDQSKAQIRFTDGTLLTLAENSVFRVDDYKFDGKSDDVFRGNLEKGALRALPGAIDSEKTKGLTIVTPVAVMGVAGTLFSMDATPKASAIGFFQGSGFIRNASGSVALGQAQRFDFANVTQNAQPYGQLEEPDALVKMERMSMDLKSPSEIMEPEAILKERNIKPLSQEEKRSVKDKIFGRNHFTHKSLIKLRDLQAEIQADGVGCH